MPPEVSVPAPQEGGDPHAKEDALREVWMKVASRLDRYPNSPKVIKAEKDAFAAYMAAYEAANGGITPRPEAGTSTPTPSCAARTGAHRTRGRLP